MYFLQLKMQRTSVVLLPPKILSGLQTEVWLTLLPPSQKMQRLRMTGCLAQESTFGLGPAFIPKTYQGKESKPREKELTWFILGFCPKKFSGRVKSSSQKRNCRCTSGFSGPKPGKMHQLMKCQSWKGLVGNLQGVLKGVYKEKESILIIYQELQEVLAFRHREGNNQDFQ